MRLIVQITCLLLIFFKSHAQTSFIHLLEKKLILPDSVWCRGVTEPSDTSFWKEKLLYQAEQQVKRTLERSFPAEFNSELNKIKYHPLKLIDINSDFTFSLVTDGSSTIIQEKLGVLGLNALSHFAGKDEVLQNAFTTFSDIKRKKEIVNDILKKSDTILRGPHPAVAQMVIGFFRPDVSGISIDLFPGIEFCRPSGWVIQIGYTRRVVITREDAMLSGYRFGTAYRLSQGLTMQLEAERLKIALDETIRKKLHLVGSIRKTIPLSGLIYTFVQFSFDFGRQISRDGYAERYSYRAGIEFRQKSRKR